MKYIDADKLIAEIEGRLIKYDPDYTSAGSELKGLLSFIASLQQEQPKVELEEEITKWIEAGDITDTRFNDYDDSDIERTARHFYELGLGARKEDIVI